MPEKSFVKCAPDAQIHAGPCVWYGPTVPQIITVRKYFVDTMRNYAIRLLTSPDIMCKYILIKPSNNNKHCGNTYMYYVRYNQKLLVFRNFQAPLSKKKNPARQALSIFCNSPQYALHPCCIFLFLFGLTNARKCERSLLYVPQRYD